MKNSHAFRYLQYAGPGRYSLKMQVSKGIGGVLARSLVERLRVTINRKNKRRINFAIETLLFNCWLADQYETALKPLYGIDVIVKYSRDESAYKRNPASPLYLSYMPCWM